MTTTEHTLHRSEESATDRVARVIAGRRAQAPEAWPDDLLSRLMRARDEETGAPMSDTLLRDESITIFFAGHETTARTLAFLWHALAGHDKVLQHNSTTAEPPHRKSR